MAQSLEQLYLISLVKESKLHTTDKIRDKEDLVRRSNGTGSMMFSPENMRAYKTRVSDTLFGPLNNIVIWSDDVASRRDPSHRVYFVGVYSETLLDEPFTDEFGNIQTIDGDVERAYDYKLESAKRFKTLREAKAFVKSCGF